MGKRALIIISYELLYMRNVIQFWFVTNIVYVGSLFRHLGSFAHMRCRLLYFYMEAIDSDDYSVGGAAPRGREEGTDARNIESNEEIKSICFAEVNLRYRLFKANGRVCEQVKVTNYRRKNPVRRV